MPQTKAYRGRLSKACETCRKRKVKCDETRPHCIRCWESHLVCAGYRQVGLRVIDQTEDTALRVVSKASIYDQTVRPGDSINRQMFLAPLIKYSWPEEYINTRCIREPAKFKSLYDNGTYESETWSPFAYCVAAFAYSNAARATGNASFAARGIQAYQNTIVALRNALKREGELGHGISHDTAATIGTIAFYEAIEDESGTHAEMHEIAFREIIKAKGPAGVMFGKSHEMFLGCRTNAILNALARREKTFFAEQDWVDVPWQTEYKSDFDRLLDIVAELASSLSDLKSCVADVEMPAPFLQNRKCIHEKLKALRGRFLRWYDASTISNSAPLRVPETSIPAKAPLYGAPPDLEYTSLSSAQSHLTYWSCLLELSMAMCDNQRRMMMIEHELRTNKATETTNTSSTSVPDLAGANDYKIDAEDAQGLYATKIEEAFQNITASIEYCMKSEFGVVGPAGLVQPLGTAIAWSEGSQKSQEMAKKNKSVYDKLITRQASLRWLV